LAGSMAARVRAEDRGRQARRNRRRRDDCPAIDARRARRGAPRAARVEPARRRQCDLPQLPIRRLQRGFRLHDPRRPAGRARQSPPRVVERLQPGRDHAHHPRRGGPVAARRQHGLGDRSAGRMRAPPALLAAVLLAAPAVAQDKPEWVGVWEGRIASYPVRACFDTWSEDGPGRGSYYYRSRREPLSLVEEDGGRWTEHAQGSDTGATWQFTERSADRLRG